MCCVVTSLRVRNIMAKLIKSIDLYTGYQHMEDAFMRFTDTVEEVGYMIDFKEKADDE